MAFVGEIIILCFFTYNNKNQNIKKVLPCNQCTVKNNVGIWYVYIVYNILLKNKRQK